MLEKKRQGFSILEVMIAVAVISALGMGIYRLQLSSLSSTQQASTQQLAMMSANSLINQMYSQLSYSNTGSISRTINSNYQDNLYSVPGSIPSTDCSATTCNVSQIAAYALYQWRSYLASSLGIPSSNICAQVCGYSTTPPSMSTSGVCNMQCANNAQPAVKIVWQSHLSSSESALGSTSSNNYVVVLVPQR